MRWIGRTQEGYDSAMLHVEKIDKATKRLEFISNSSRWVGNAAPDGLHLSAQILLRLLEADALNEKQIETIIHDIPSEKWDPPMATAVASRLITGTLLDLRRTIAEQEHDLAVVSNKSDARVSEVELRTAESYDRVAKELISSKREFDNSLQEARRAAAAAAVAASEAADRSYTRTLADARTQHEQRATVVLIMLALLGLFILMLSSVLFRSMLADVRAFGTLWWAPLVARALAFGSLAGIAVWVMRMYRAERHNEIVYAQKLAALRTFESFTEVANRDQDAKAAIVAHAMSTIFAMHDTGYTNGNITSAESAMPTEALIRTLSASIAAAKQLNESTPAGRG